MILVKNGIMAIDGNLLHLMVEYALLHAELFHREPEMALAVEAYLSDLTEEARRNAAINGEQMVSLYKALVHSGMLEEIRKEWNKSERT